MEQPKAKFNVQITIEIQGLDQSGQYYGEDQLHIRDSLKLEGPKNFLDLCRVLGRFQDLADQIRAENGRAST